MSPIRLSLTSRGAGLASEEYSSLRFRSPSARFESPFRSLLPPYRLQVVPSRLRLHPSISTALRPPSLSDYGRLTFKGDQRFRRSPQGLLPLVFQALRGGLTISSSHSIST